jgi:exportin-2 (importin alpha re-exporter)
MNNLVDVVQFFSDHVFEDLQADASTVHPILQVDAIKYLHTFRQQASAACVCPCVSDAC